MRDKTTMRNKATKANHRKRIAELRLAFVPVVEIAARLRISTTTVNRELRALSKEWREAASSSVEEWKDRELQSLEVLEKKALAEWERSRKDYSKETTERFKFPGKGEDGGDLTTDPTVTKRETGGRLGDPKLLQVLLNIKDQRAKLLGLHAPVKVAPTDPTGEKPYSAMGDQELNARISELMAKAALKNPPSPF